MTKIGTAFVIIGGMAASMSSSVLAGQAPTPRFVSRNFQLADGELAQIRGGFEDKRAILTRTTMMTMLDLQSDQQFRSTGTLSGVMMDNWWNDYGAQWIVTNLTTPR